MIRVQPVSKRTDPPCPYTTLFRSAAGIGRSARIGDAHRRGIAARDAEIEPLVEIGLVIGLDLQLGRVVGDRKDADVAAVEGARDLDAHLTSIVTPDSPGKS